MILTATLLISCTPRPNTAAAITPTIVINPSVTVSSTRAPDNGTNAGDVIEELPKSIEISFWHPWSGRMANLVSELINEFNQDNEWGITVLAEAYADDLVLAQRVAGELEGDDQLPDVIAAPDFLFSFAEENGLFGRQEN